VTVAAAALLASAGPADADKIDSKKAEIAQVQEELSALDRRLEAAIEAYNGAKVQLSSVREKIKVNTQRLEIARKNLKAARAALADFLVATYKGDTADVTTYVLGSGSFSELIDRVDFAQRISEQEGELVEAVLKAETEIEQRQQQLKADERTAERLVKEAAARKHEVQSALTARTSMLSSLRGDLRQLIQERQARIDAAARARAAALAQQQATQQSSGGAGGGSVPTVDSSPPPPAGSTGQQAVAIAQRYLGVPYVWGGASPSGFDCSGFTMYVYAQLGVSLPHYTGSQWGSGAHVSMSQLAPGDLVFFYPDLGHVGIYMGGGLFIHAPHTGDVVKISSLSGYYAANFVGGVRVA
jgi:cell wall-associated NlpC family hydrolase